MSLFSMVLPWWVRWTVLAAAIAAVYATGDIRGRVAVHNAWDKEKLAQAEVNNAALSQVIIRSNVLTGKLQQAQGAIDRLSKEKRNEIFRRTDGTHCLGAGAIGLLNHTTDGVPAPAASPAAEDAAGAAADTGNAASDRDIAGWIIEAQHQYELCSVRLNSLIDFVSQ
jgi:hypothetical protein